MAETTTTRGPAATPTLLGARLRLTAHPETFAEQFLNSSAVWLALMAYWALADLVHGAFPSGGRQVPPDGWLTHLALTLLGLAALWAMHRSGFRRPGMGASRRGAGCCFRWWPARSLAWWRSRWSCSRGRCSTWRQR